MKKRKSIMSVDESYPRPGVTFNAGRPNELTVEADRDGSYRILGSGHGFIMGDMAIVAECANLIVIKVTK